MAVLFTTIKNTNQETIIHFDTVLAESGTITIANLGASTQTRNSDAPAVNIVKFCCTGQLDSGLLIVRNGKNIISCAPENDPFLDLNSNGFVDNINNTYDIVVTNLAAKAVTGYIVLRKVAGWSTEVETATFGSYDNPTVVGS